MTNISHGQGTPKENVLNQSVNLDTQDKYAFVPEELKSKSLWCCYSLVANSDPTKKPSKIPKNPINGKNSRVNDTGTLTTFQIARDAVLAGRYDGLNFAFFYDPELVGIDLDNVLDDSRKFTCEEAEEVFDRFKKSGAYIERSPSGKGLRFICKKRPETFVRFGKGTKNKDFECYGAGAGGLHFLSVTGDAFYSVDSVPFCDEVLSWFSTEYFYENPTAQKAIGNESWEFSPELSDDEVIEKIRKSKRGKDFALLFDEGHQNHDESVDDLILCSIIAFYTQDYEQIKSILNESALVREKWETHPDYLDRTIKKALNGLSSTWQPRPASESWEQELLEHVTELNQSFASVIIGGKHRIMKYDRFSKVRTFIPEHELGKVYRNSSIQTGIDARGNAVYKNHFKAWYDHPDCKVYRDGVIFKPRQSMSDMDTRFNLWQGFAVKPIEGDCQLILAHIKDVISSGDDAVNQYILDWVAYSVQKPDRPAGTALVVRGAKGSGKGSLGHFLMSLWGSHGLHISNSNHLTGNFNAHLAETCFLFSDEAFFSGDRKHERTLKALVTEPVFTIERKGLDAIQQPNYLKIFMATNSDFAVPASRDERRFLVTDCSDSKIGDFSYFDRLHSTMNDRTVKQAFLHLMLNRDISAYKAGKIPETKALQDQRFHSFEPHQAWLAECLSRGTFELRANPIEETFSSNWVEEMPSSKLFEYYENWCQMKSVPNYHRVPFRILVGYLKKIFKGKIHVLSQRGIRGIDFGSLSEAIAQFELVERVNVGDCEL